MIPSSSEDAIAAAAPAADVAPSRSFTEEPANRKTDYDLAWERFFGTHNSDEEQQRLHQPVADIQETNPWSVVIVLSMPFRIVQYLMLISHGFRSYLVEEPNMDACIRQGISKERLKVIAQQAGMIVAITNAQLPSLDSNPEESPLWLQLVDRKALRAVLLGVGKALVQDPVREVIQKSLGQDERDLRKGWDRILDQVGTSGTKPNEDEWVMDDRSSRQKNTRSADLTMWGEVSTEDKRAQQLQKQPQQQRERNVTPTRQRRRAIEARSCHPFNASRAPSVSPCHPYVRSNLFLCTYHP